MSTVIWRLDALKRREKIIRENAFEQKKKNPGLEFNLGLALIGLWTTCRAMNIWVSWLISSGSPSSARHTIQRYNEAILEWTYRLQSWNETKSEHQFCLLSILFSEFHQGNAEILPRAERHFENECFLSIKSHECGQVKEQAPRNSWL